MKSYTFRVTQPLVAFYEGEVTVQASNEKAAKNKLLKMSQKNLEDICTGWEQNTDNADPNGAIEIQECVNEIWRYETD